MKTIKITEFTSIGRDYRIGFDITTAGGNDFSISAMVSFDRAAGKTKQEVADIAWAEVRDSAAIESARLDGPQDPDPVPDAADLAGEEFVPQPVPSRIRISGVKYLQVKDAAFSASYTAEILDQYGDPITDQTGVTLSINELAGVKISGSTISVDPAAVTITTSTEIRIQAVKGELQGELSVILFPKSTAIDVPATIARLEADLAAANESSLTTMSALADTFEMVLVLQDDVAALKAGSGV